jgi:uncharacterized protein YjcR
MTANWNRERAKVLWLEGFPATQISARLGVGRVTLKRYAAAEGWPERPAARHGKPAGWHDEARAMWDAGKTIAAIAAAAGVTASHMGVHVRGQGWPPRSTYVAPPVPAMPAEPLPAGAHTLPPLWSELPDDRRPPPPPLLAVRRGN